jgi:hypothetical protein
MQIQGHSKVQGGNGEFPGFPILGNSTGIPEIQLKFSESDGNPGNTMKIPGIQLKS